MDRSDRGADCPSQPAGGCSQASVLQLLSPAPHPGVVTVPTNAKPRPGSPSMELTATELWVPSGRAQLNLIPHCVRSKSLIFVTSATVHEPSGVALE